jgi:hypothetical protein
LYNQRHGLSSDFYACHPKFGLAAADDRDRAFAGPTMRPLLREGRTQCKPPSHERVVQSAPFDERHLRGLQMRLRLRAGLSGSRWAGAVACAGLCAVFVLSGRFFRLDLRAQGVSDSPQIAGFVRDASSHEPVVSARIDLISPRGFAAPTTYTNTEGEFRFDYVKDGDYQVEVRKMGYEDAKLAVSVVAGHHSHVEVDLEPKSDSVEDREPAETVSAHELTVPENAREDYRKGRALMAKEDYTGAVAAFLKATQESPTYYEAYAKLGVSQYMSGHADEARAALEKSMELSEGKYAEAAFDLADVFNDVGNFSDAEPLARRGIALDASSWQGQFELARSLLGMKRYADAERSAKKCLAMKPQNKQLYIVLTNIHIELHEYPAVVEDIDAYLKLDPNSAASEQMRATRAQVLKAMATAKKKSSGGPP